MQRPVVHATTSSTPVGPSEKRGHPLGCFAGPIISLSNLHRRLLTSFFRIIGPRLSYRVTGFGARMLYRLLEPFRARSEAQCHAALRDQVPAACIGDIAEQSFVNRARNLTDMMMAPHLLRAKTFQRFGGRIAEPLLTYLLERQLRRQPTILLTAYYGSFDLLPVFLGYNGIRATVVYRPHSNRRFDAERKRVRSQSGCELVPVEDAAARFSRVLGDGGTVALVADHHNEQRGMPVKFLGLETKVLRSVGLLAWRYEADVVVAGIRRLNDTFQFELVVPDVVRFTEWRSHGDPVAYVSDRYLRALERLILKDPTQYLWGYARWGEDFARRAVTTGD